MMAKLTLRFESLKRSEIYQYLKGTRCDFPRFYNEECLTAYSDKLSLHAKFVTGRDEAGQICCLMAYYDDNSPVIYRPYAHVSLKYRRNGYFKKMGEMLESRYRELGYTSIRLEVNKNNKPALTADLYSGFQPICDNGEKLLMEKVIS